jgi:putative nucleotidyltransferase with HDIG domain
MDAPNYPDIVALVDVLSSKRDPYNHHAPRVAVLAVQLARLFDLPAHDVAMVDVGAQLHDIGKLVQKSDIINQARKLTPAEMDMVRLHPQQGYEIVSQLRYDPIVQDIVLHHHENWDGSGYPDKLRGEAISMHARIVHVVDVYDAMSQPRPYRKALSFGNVRSQIELQAGSMFDTKLVDLFFRRVVRE